jgi:tetratricopeptide (TPR) repeat protein
MLNGLDLAMSTPEEWNQAGRVLFGRRLFTQAASCFDKAHRQHDREVSIAYQLREDARAVNIQDRKLHQKRIRLFREAARAFQSCTESSTSDSDRHNCYRHAGECFLKAEDFEFAAKSFKAAKEFTEAALLFRKIGDFDEAIDIVKPYTGEESLVDPSVKDEIIKVAKLEYARKHDFKCVLFSTLISQSHE